MSDAGAVRPERGQSLFLVSSRQKGQQMTDHVTIRRLEPGDRDEWIRLRHALWPHAELGELHDEADTLAADPRQPVFVAACGGRLCGMVEASIRTSAPGCHTENIGYLEGWYVEPAWREQGIGGRLVAAAEVWARAEGCTEMASDTTSDYPLSPTAHARLGYEETRRDIFFAKKLLP